MADGQGGWNSATPRPPAPPRRRRSSCATAVLAAVVVGVVLVATVAIVARFASNQQTSQPPNPQPPPSVTTAPAPTTSTPGATVPLGEGRADVARWMTNTSPAAWDGVSNRIYYNTRTDAGVWSGHSAAPDGTDVRCVTCDLPTTSGPQPGVQRAVSDVTPDGAWVLLTVEKAQHPPPVGSSYSAPGRGLYNDLWLVRSDGSAAFPLTTLSLDPVSGAIWPRFDRTGTQIVWAQMHQGFDVNHPLGYWSMHVASVDLDGDHPTLRDERTYDPQPGRFYEPYEFSPDNARIIFASDVDTPSVSFGPSQTNSQIWTIDAATLSDVRKVSPDAPLTGMFANYNEFAYYLPGSGGTRVMFARTFQSTDHGMDIWTTTADGGDLRRLTFLNEPGDPQHAGYSVFGGAAFDPHDPKRFVVGVSQSSDGESINAYFVTLP